MERQLTGADAMTMKPPQASTRVRRPKLSADFFDRDVARVAEDLIGCDLMAGDDRSISGGMIVEVEAYDDNDPASHSFRGRTERNAVMFGPPGRLYVYRSYGIHWCLNVSTGSVGIGAAVLLRAIVPEHGVHWMQKRRGQGIRSRDLARGPGRLTQALGIDATWNALPVGCHSFQIFQRSLDSEEVVSTPRIGISRAKDVPWRFILRGSCYVSGPKALRGC